MRILSARKIGLTAAAALTALSLTQAFGQPGRFPPGPAFDTAQFPETHGIVQRYTLSPRGDVEGLILRDGTQVQFPPHLGSQLVFAARPGEAVTVRGLRALSAPMVAAVWLRNDATGSEVVDAGGPPHRQEASLEAAGQVQTVLRGRQGEVNGAILADGTTVRLPPDRAERFAELLRPGATLAVRGQGRSTVFGTVIEAQAIGPNPQQLTEFDWRGPRDDRRPPPPRPPRG
jgi:hypothetical protein